ncbi:uncharacterized protein IL334_004921 [Kwoniella shivajii]|uniref:Ubiquitin-like domain-containing protein n=1 Tax=Kwoniella shivajii TaxID=564305 RepID=A0ABZ1D5N0_9TREE|nr:hypothetical protein IL334_004921 [Kwoniella shivajii]
MPGSSNTESEPLLPISIPSSTAPSRSRLSARRYITPTSPINNTKNKGKGKGKGKAREDDIESGITSVYNDNNEEEQEEQEQEEEDDGIKLKRKVEKRGRHVTIIFSNESDLTGGGNLDCWVEDGENVGSVKDQIKTLRPSLHSHNLRLIHSGRLLTDGILLLPWLRSLEERVRRQAAGVGGDVENVLKEVGLTEDLSDSDPDPRGHGNGLGLGVGSNESRSKKDENERVWLHCIVGGKEEKSSSTSEHEEPSAPRRRGFDVLLDAGLSADDVAAMRRQFYESRGEEVPEGMEGGDVNDEHARALEEQWIEGDMTAETASTTSEGMYTSILHGLLTGFLFPILPWFFFREPPLPNFFDSEYQAIEFVRSRSISISPSTYASASTLNANGSGARGSSTSGPNQGVEIDRPTSPIPPSTATTTTNTTPAVSTQDRLVRAGGIVGLGEVVASQVFGKRMQMGILLGTILNIAFGALRFLN